MVSDLSNRMKSDDIACGLGATAFIACLPSSRLGGVSAARYQARAAYVDEAHQPLRLFPVVAREVLKFQRIMAYFEMGMPCR